MHKHFSIIYKDAVIQVERENEAVNAYVLKYPDAKFIVLDWQERGWVVEDRSGDYWTDADIIALGDLIDKNDPAAKEK